jgi:MinD-like ATPase involved in chromosome partitioning or flagellar assembly
MENLFIKILFLSYKGGVGKSSIAQNMALDIEAAYVTNDLVTTSTQAIQIEPNKHRIPKALLSLECVVFDFGAMSTKLDPKAVQATDIADVIVIPTLTDMRSLEATIKTVKLVESKEKPIAIIINNFSKQKDFDEAELYLTQKLGDIPIFAIKATTLFKRVAKDGPDFYRNIHNDLGEWQLNKSRLAHEQVYNAILNLG